MRKRVSIFLLMPLLATGCKSPGPSASLSHLEGKVAPDFTLKDLENQDITLSDYRGKPVILAFWAYG